MTFSALISKLGEVGPLVPFVTSLNRNTLLGGVSSNKIIQLRIVRNNDQHFTGARSLLSRISHFFSTLIRKGIFIANVYFANEFFWLAYKELIIG